MLVLSRKKDEEIVFELLEAMPAGTRIVVTQVDIRGDKSRFGITAPKSVAVHRGEVQAAIDHDRAAIACLDRNRVESGSQLEAELAPM